MNFPLDFRVKNIHTGQIGRVTRWLSDEMVMLNIDGDEIPAFVEDLLPANSDERSESLLTKKMLKNAAPPPPPASPTVLKIMGGMVENRGILLAFEPIPLPNGLVSGYKIWLLNDSPDDLLFVFSWKTTTGKSSEIDEKSASRSCRFLGEMPYENLNLQPEISFEMRQLTTAGPSEPRHKSLKIKGKTFFQSLQLLPILENEAHVLSLFEKNELEKTGSPTSPKQPAESLADYSKKLAKKAVKPTAEQRATFRWLDLEEKAGFEPEIDLHIEKLVNDASKLTPGEIVQIQLRQTENFLDRAWRLGIDQVFLIHGIGAGKLRDLIHARLRNRPEIASFRNEFHRKYGYGATEVIFK